jgi:hypothetical protein
MLGPVMSIDPADTELLARQAGLQAEADSVVEDLGLMAILGSMGRPVRTGSSALGLMVARDIDITTLCRDLDPGALFSAIAPLAGHPRVRQLGFRNDTGHWNTDPTYPDGLYWSVGYVRDSEAAWNLDLWFIREGTTQFDLQHIEALPPRLTSETRLAILRIKTAVADPTWATLVQSYEIYEAVLDHGIRTAEAFADLRESSR